jgi:PHD/YefM family antitoxin component YafN of YafNO toxin-antitoxin module
MSKATGKTRRLRKVDPKLKSLSKAVQSRLDRYVIDYKGEPQSVLLAYQDFQGLNAVLDLLSKPEELASIRTGLDQLKAGKRVTWEEAEARIRQNRKQTLTTDQLASELATKSINQKTVAAVLSALFVKLSQELGKKNDVHLRVPQADAKHKSAASETLERIFTIRQSESLEEEAPAPDFLVSES